MRHVRVCGNLSELPVRKSFLTSIVLGRTIPRLADRFFADMYQSLPRAFSWNRAIRAKS